MDLVPLTIAPSSPLGGVTTAWSRNLFTVRAYSLARVEPIKGGEVVRYPNKHTNETFSMLSSILLSTVLPAVALALVVPQTEGFAIPISKRSQ